MNASRRQMVETQATLRQLLRDMEIIEQRTNYKELLQVIHTARGECIEALEIIEAQLGAELCH